jgi:pimeloyl-ACP methyl ester carboxylesterase
MGAWLTFERDGVRLACLDFGGAGPSALLLHGLAGHAGEWAETASWLSGRCRVVALDQRGHGRSERQPADVSREAHVADVADAIRQLDLGPVLLVGQSLGGHLAMLVAARHPDLVRGLVVAEASPIQASEEHAEGLGQTLTRWPVPFDSRQAAIEFFDGPSLCADAWTDGLEHRDGGWWPRFDIDVMVRTLREATRQDYWDEWERIRCPTLVIRAGAGTLSAEDAQAMLHRLPSGRLVELPGAVHDLHLDQPAQWREAVMEFVVTLDEIPATD